jgi:lambda repressor-like predicted transcriptional regulator
MEPEAVVAAVRSRLGLSVTASLLFAPSDGSEVDPELDRFVAITVSEVDLDTIDREAFELSYAIADATGALTAEPELGTDFFVMPSEEGLEGAIEVPGCWVPEGEDIAAAQPFWAVDKINARAAWNLSPAPGGKAKGQGVLVFQPDTGVADHDEIEAGMLDLARAHDFVANRPGATDPLNYSGNPGHGTGTASVVASRAAGKMAGSAPLATLVPLRAIESVIVFDHGRVAAAVEHARRNGTNVITMSLGGAWSSSLRSAIGRALADGVIVMAAAGNCVKFVVWPARYEEVVAVSGTNSRDEAWRGSCRGEAVDISAPAEFVPRAKRNPADGGGPHMMAGGQGTSFAVAITAGVAALWLAYHTVSAVKAVVPHGGSVQALFASLMRASARCPPGFDTSTMGAGIVDAEALLNAGLAFVAEEAPVVSADPYHSLHTLLAEAGGAEAVLGAVDQRRFAAELSHHALSRARAATTGQLESAAGGSMRVPLSETLKKAADDGGAAAALLRLVGG